MGKGSDTPINYEVGIFIRKPASHNHSIEFLFREIVRRLPSNINAMWLEAPRASEGLWKRIKLIFWAKRNEKQINHVSGDLHFINLLWPKKSSILTIHDCEFITRSKGIRKFLLRLFWLILPISRCKVVTTISEASKREIVALSGVDERKVMVIPNFVNERIVPKGHSTIHGTPKGLIVGTKPNKNIARIVQATKNINIQLVIVGEISENVLRLLQENGADYSNHIHISEEEMIEVYQSCDLLLFPSLKEGFGLPILEAQAAGVPVITSNRSSMPEVGGEGAVYVDPYDIKALENAIVNVLQDEKERDELIRKGFINVEKYSVNNTVNQFVDLYKKVGLGI